MSLWTPGGEHQVPREPQAPAPPQQAAAPQAPAAEEDPFAGLSPEEQQRAREMAEEMADVRRQLASVPADVVVANHVMGLYELAAIHLSEQPPHLEDARLAIDAMGAVVEQLPGRLGEAEATLRDALNQLRMAYVQLAGDRSSGAAPT